EGFKGSLATWVCDLATGMGKTEHALRAAEVAFRANPDLNTYLKVQELAGSGWPELKSTLLDHLRRTISDFLMEGHVEVFLHENLLDDAISAVKRTEDDDLIQRVMDAAMEHRPSWVIRRACREAERIIDASQAKYYDRAVRWLEKAKAAHQATGQKAKWQAYVDEIRANNRRKSKLIGLLERL
ncbi:MAG: hypothetical protein L0Y56_21705, partial [Nitrospira sp.]|nr:hypothetical protein [Nitrospira sp.]